MGLSSEIALGIVLAILVGAALGVYLLPKLYHKKHLITSLKRDFSIFEQELLFVTKPMISFSIDNVENAPIPMTQTYDAIRSRRIELYQKYLKNKRNELDNLKNYEISFKNFVITSRELNSKLTDLITLNIPNGNHKEIDSRYVYTYFMGQLLNLPDHEAVSLTEIPAATINRVLKVYAKIIHNESLIQIGKDYLEKKKEVESKYARVRSQIQQIPR